MAGAGIGGFRTRGLARRLDVAERAATTDTLTGLANRAGLRREFQRLVARSEYGEHLGLALLDLNGFKPINDTYGHEVGDRLLTIVGARLAQLRVEGQLVCASRLGGDEFVVLFSSGRCPETGELATDVAHAVEGAVGAPVRIGSACIRPHASVGITCKRASRARLSDMLAEADAAMYRAKRHSGDVYAHIGQIDGRLDVAHRPGRRARDRRLQTGLFDARCRVEPKLVHRSGSSSPG